MIDKWSFVAILLPMDELPEIDFNSVMDYIAPFAERIRNDLLAPRCNFAIFGGFLRDAVLGMSWAKKTPLFNDIDVVLDKPLAGASRNKNIASLRYNAFGGKKIQMNDGLQIEIFSRHTKRLDRFPYGMALNCNRLAYLHDEKKILILPEFRDFLKTKTIEISCAGKYDSGPGGANLHAIITALKLRQKFGADLGLRVGDDIKNNIRLLSETETKEITNYISDKINKGGFFLLVNEFFQKIKS
jgi:hypothetical protein